MTRIVALQLASALCDLAGNLARATAALTDALQQGAEVVVLPELVTSGYLFADAEEARAAGLPTTHPVFGRWAQRLGGAVLVVGFAELGADGRLYNSAAVLDASGLRAVYRKVHLWNREKELFTPGDALPPVVETSHGRIGVMICFDLEFPEWTRIAALAGADLLAVPTNWPALEPAPAGDRAPEVEIGVATARMNRMAIAFADRVGVERGVDWTAGTGIVSAEGRLIDSAGSGVGAAWADLDLAASRDKGWGELVDLFGDRRPDLYGGLASTDRSAQPGATAQPGDDR